MAFGRWMWLLGAFPLAAAEDVLNVLFMADIGHSRNHADDLTTPFPMGKCAYEGAFSLYEGLEDFIVNQGAKPTAALIVGDIAYGGGSQLVNNATRHAFQKYLHGQVPVDRVYPVMGNHDIHFLGCSKGEVLTPFLPCYYGTAHTSVVSNYEMTFSQWRENWMTAFPGLSQVLLPAKEPEEQWIAPLRYNLNLDNRSSVHFIAGLISGVYRTYWNNDTPAVAVDAMGSGGDTLECRFLRDSLEEGRRLKKSIFIYMTHNFAKACKDWSLIRQLDVWITGHKHSRWQSEPSRSEMAQEFRHYPLRILIGNGGFDEGASDTVSFGHLREVPYKDGDQERVKLHFDIYDTCISDDWHCPLIGLTGPYCWDKCQAMPGGIDGGGGPRKATTGLHFSGFTFDAPRANAAPTEWASDLFGKTWLLRLKEKWLGLGPCPFSDLADCLVPVRKEDAIPVTLFGRGSRLPRKGDLIEAGLALQDEIRGFVTHDDENVMQRGYGFWTPDFYGHGRMKSEDADLFTFTKDGKWLMQGAAWKENDDDQEYLAFDGSQMLEVDFEASQVSVYV